jgi:hypothetical protein
MVRRGVFILLVVIISLLAAWPVSAARRVEVDVVLLADTSDSMADELRALCDGVEEVVADMDRRGITVNAVTLGVAETRACADQRVTRLISDGQTEDKEDWGLAVADLARHYEWTPGATRLIIPLSDEGPLGGDPVDDDDERAVQEAIRAAQANDVVVSPVLGTDFNSEVEPLARDLAEETDGRVFLSEKPDDDLADGLCDLILAVADRVRAAAPVSETIPTPLDIVFDGRVVSTNLVLAILLTLVLGVASVILDDTLSGNRVGLGASGLGRLVAAAVNLGRAAEGLLSSGEWLRLSARPRRLVAVIQLALFLVLMAFLGLFLKPGLSPISWTGLGLGLGMLLALLFLNLIYDGGQYWLARRAGAAPTLRLRLSAPLAAFGSVVLSRIFGFVPGYFYARATRCTFPSEATEAGLPDPRRVRIALIGLGVVGAVGLSFWILTIPTSLMIEFIEGLKLGTTLNNISTGLVGMVQGLFSLCFFLAWQMLLFEMLPLQSTDGGVIYRHNRPLWAVVVFGALFVLLHTLVNPFGATDQLLGGGGLVLLLLSALFYSALAVGVWLYFALRTGGAVAADGSTELAEVWGRGQRTTVMAISLIVLWVLGACSGLVMLVARWLG